MKNVIKTLAIIFIALFTFSACSKDDDPTDNTLFTGKYEGRVSYIGEGENKSNENGSVTVIKIGDNYNFNFSDGIPSLNGIKMNKGDATRVIFEDGALGTINISASDLHIAYTKDGETWTADCKR